MAHRIHTYLNKLTILASSVLVITAVLFSCQKEVNTVSETVSENIQLHFKPVVSGQNLELGNTYTNAHNETFRLRAFKFYISAIDLINDVTGATYQLDRNQYYLIDCADSASLTFKFKAPASRYNKIAFTVGVDSIRNVSGAQTGALDPANGMFWTWNSGYIMAKLEGYSAVSTQPNQLFEYHIGGFKGENNVVQKLYLPLPAGTLINTEAEKASNISITADVNKWFAGPAPVSIANVPVCTSPGPLAKSIAGNYLQMFSVVQVTNQ